MELWSTERTRASTRILLVEDEGLTALDTSELLTSLGYEVVGSVFSAREAIREVEKDRPDLVLLDIRLRGGMDGIAAGREIRSRFDVPIIYASAYSDDATVERAKLTEPFGYILKPFDERELKTTIEVALYRHRMERQRADLLAMLSHDIRNPLGVILGYADMLGEHIRTGNRGRAEALLGQLSSTALSLHSLVSNYLDASRINGGRFALRAEPLPLDELAARVCRQYGGEAERRSVRLEVIAGEPPPLARADPVATERILANLVYNAIKFTPPGGRVTIAATARGPDVVVEVEDSGPGIPAERLPGLFDGAGTTTSPRHGGGTGLGLYIVRTLAEAQGGRVEVASTLGCGTRFSVHFPAATTA